MKQAKHYINGRRKFSLIETNLEVICGENTSSKETRAIGSMKVISEADGHYNGLNETKVLELLSQTYQKDPSILNAFTNGRLHYVKYFESVDINCSLL